MFSIVIALLVFFVGLAIGSFLNVLIYRTIHGEDFVKGRSKCPSCKKQIAWYDNIPLLSYFFLGGKCRNCGKTISVKYPAIELLTGFLFVWWYGVGSAFFQLTQSPFSLIQPLFWLLVGVFLLIILVTDYLYMIIPDYAIISLGILGVAYRLVLTINGIMQWSDFWLALAIGAGLSLFIGSLWFFTKGRGMGFGDVKYALVMGILLGWPRGLVGMFMAFVMGALFGIGLLITRKRSFGQKIPFGPFLVLGTLGGLLWGEMLWGWYISLMI